MTKKLKVLIIDDSAMWQKIIGMFANNFGLEIAGFGCDGLDGYIKYKQLRPDIVTLDVEMPQMDGLKALEKILEYDSNAKIIMISSKSDENIVRKALLMGAKDYIVKDGDMKKWGEAFNCVIKDNMEKDKINNMIIKFTNKIRKFIKTFT